MTARQACDFGSGRMRFTPRVATLSCASFFIALACVLALWTRSPRHNDVLTVQIGKHYFIDLQSWTGACSVSYWSGEHPFMSGTSVDFGWGTGADVPEEKKWHAGFDLTVGYPFTEPSGYSSLRMPHWTVACLTTLLLIPAWVHCVLKKRVGQVEGDDARNPSG